ncbi:helix-turn-helix domain-containing protein [Ferrimicrobium sp.]|uniref:helix-turn-helix domain-containing protein n=1 Tax=Ferrimicrobium sp. TaxID=2926050 RepID=UPI00344D3DD1
MLLDYDQAATYLNTSARHVRQLWQDRKLSAVKVGRLVRFDTRDLDKFIDANRHEATR